jgi:uncharacterized protein
MLSAENHGTQNIPLHRRRRSDRRLPRKLAAQSPMPMRTLGKTGMQVSLFCLGGFHMRKNGEENGVRLIDRALDLGVNFFDSAHKYHQGESDITYGAVFKDPPSARKRC